MRWCIKKPSPDVLKVPVTLSQAVDAHLAGATSDAETLFQLADSAKAYRWLVAHWIAPQMNVRRQAIEGDTAPVPPELKDADRVIFGVVRSRVLARDGYVCRYCDLPVVPAEVRKHAHRLYPQAVLWDPVDERRQHAGFQCLWLQYDHVIPHSHGGRSTVDNVVVSCSMCNFGKWNYTLGQLDIADPRTREPRPSSWDGLMRLLPLSS